MDKGDALKEVFASHGIKLGGSGNISCPFHEDNTPSMSVDRERGLYKCHSCGRSGDVFTFLQEVENLSFKDAVTRLGMDEVSRKPVETVQIIERVTPVPVSRVEQYETLLTRCVTRLWHSPDVLAYLRGRGFTDDTIRDFRLGLGVPEMGRGDGMLVIPYLGPNGRPVSFRMRCVEDHKHEGHGKYEGLTGDRTRIFNTNTILGNPTVREVHVCEGELDTMSLAQCGLVAVGFPGVNTVKPHHLVVLRSFDTVYLWCDNDNPGNQMAEKLLGWLPQAKRVFLPTGDVNELLVSGGSAAVLERIGR